MIYNNGLSTTNQIQSKPVTLSTDIKQSLTQLQSLPAFQSNASSPLMQNLLQLVQTLVQQLEKETQPNTKKEGNGKQDKENQQQQSNQQQDTRPIPIHNHIIGTNADDKLKGARGNDHILGLDGNDRLYGRQGDDLLSGGKGSDRLYGGQGNDTLIGGQGNDYLSGGRGNNVLLGGQGNDILASRLGSDLLDGGSGEDTARIRGNIDDYSFKITTVFPHPTNLGDPVILGAPTNNGIVLTHKETGQTISVVNIEKFRFNDVQLSTDELRKRIENQSPPLKLSDQEHKAISNYFNHTPPSGTADGITVRFTGIALDQDGNGKLSVGDTVKLHYTGGIAGIDEIRDHVLTDKDLEGIKNANYKELPLDSKQQQRALDLFSPFHTFGEFVRVLDVNGDGKVSKGDIAIHLRGPDPVPSNAEESDNIELGRMILSEQQASVINGTALVEAQKELNANKEKWETNDIQDYSYQFKRSCFCPQEITRPVDITVKDGKVIDAQFGDIKDKPPEQNQLSVKGLFDIIQNAIDRGSQIEVKYDEKTGMPTEIIIDRDQMPVDGGQTITASNLKINTPDEELKLTEKQQDAIGARFNRIPPPNLMDAPTIQYTGVSIDKDGDGELGVGDVVKLQSMGGFRPPGDFDTTFDHVLTADDIAFIEKDRSNPLLDISNGLSQEQSKRLGDVLNIMNANSTIDQIYDNNSDGKLSAGDTVAIQRVIYSSTPVFTNDNGQQSVGDSVAVSIEFHTLTQDEIDQYLQGGNTQAHVDFKENKETWESTRPENYSFTLQRSGFIGGDAAKPVDLTIHGNTIVDARFSDGSNAMVPEYNQLSVTDLFKTIGNAFDNNAAKVEVKYNADTGVPESIFVDQSEFIADEELYLSISNFKNLDDDTGSVSGGGVSIGGEGHLDGITIPNDRIVEIGGQNYSVGFLKEQVDDYADSSYVPTGAVDAAFGIFDWGTSNSMAAGSAFQSYIADNFPFGELKLAEVMESVY